MRPSLTRPIFELFAGCLANVGAKNEPCRDCPRCVGSVDDKFVDDRNRIHHTPGLYQRTFAQRLVGFFGICAYPTRPLILHLIDVCTPFYRLGKACSGNYHEHSAPGLACQTTRRPPSFIEKARICTIAKPMPVLRHRHNFFNINPSRGLLKLPSPGKIPLRHASLICH